MYYDNIVRFDITSDSIKLAKNLGWSGLVHVHEWGSDFKALNKKIGFDIIQAAEIKGSPQNIKKISQKIRKQVDIIIVRGGGLEVNRAAVETPYVDVLTQPWGDPVGELRSDPGFNFVMAKLAKENNVHIDFSFNDLVQNHKKTRVRLFSHMTKVAKHVKKYKAPFIISSGSMSTWDMRSPSDLKSFGRLLGFEDSQIKKSMSDGIVKENQKRKKSGWIRPGVEIV